MRCLSRRMNKCAPSGQGRGQRGGKDGHLQKSTASSHFFRRCYATLGLISGASLITVSQNRVTPEKFYLHLVHGLKDQVVDYLPAFA